MATVSGKRTALCLIAALLLTASIPPLQAFCIYNDSSKQ
jgi:hypothetical protein